jgi:hypothetical protein
MTNPIVLHVLHSTGFNKFYAAGLCKDIPEDQATAQPVAGKTLNHAKWVIGQLAVVNDHALGMLGQKGICPENWNKLYGNKTIPSSDPGQPTLAELLSTFEKNTDLVVAAVKSTPDSFYNAPSPERLKARFPTNGDFLVFLLTAHASIHLGQFSAWRRAMGYPSVMG